ncbi:MAG: DUF3604 domain-containing protein [Proteobacteria bacterium]|nr:DUF3604 domain-containing protein [Pseudomonadota bacterium]
MIPVPSEAAGTVEIDRTGPFEAGSLQSFILTYRAGRYGIDDSGSLKICWRFASDQGQPQFDRPDRANYVSVEASNGAKLAVRFDPKQNTRPWDRTLYIKVAQHFLREADTITVRFGDPRQGSPGLRMQSFADPHFSLRVLVDPIATYTYVEVPGMPVLPIVAGPAAVWHAVLPSWRHPGATFALGVRCDDRWGNPAPAPGGRCLMLRSNLKVEGLPETLEWPDGAAAVRCDGISVRAPGTVVIDVLDAAGTLLTRSNPLVVDAATGAQAYWGDLHAQSGETIGSGSALDYMRFARDHAFLDAVGHQANDFQVTPEFWQQLNTLMASWNAPGRFVTVPGYEWSGNTALGGDRNVFFATEDRPIRRSSHALVADRADADLDCLNVHELFAALSAANEDAIVWAHCGGRYADIAYAHDHALERAVEVHSSWGTFEWLVEDALSLGYRVGIVANSDGHKGRPGAEMPGASLFGAPGGLTCYWLPELTRAALFAAMRARHHYATTGCRMHLMVRAELERPSVLWHDDPRVPGASSQRGFTAMMGDIVQGAGERVRLSIEVVAASPIIGVELRRGTEVVETVRPQSDLPLGRRVWVAWSGAEYRGRARQTVWDGRLQVAGAGIARATPINFFNPDRVLQRVSDHELGWASITTGNFSAVDLLLDDTDADIRVDTPHGVLHTSVAALGLTPLRVDCGGLGRELRASRLPEAAAPSSVSFSRELALRPGVDNPFYVCVTTEDGHQAWSSPIYCIP